MDLQKIEIFDQDEQLATAISLLCEAQAILDKSNYDVAAAHIQMAIDHCKKQPQSPDTA